MVIRRGIYRFMMMKNTQSMSWIPLMVAILEHTPVGEGAPVVKRNDSMMMVLDILCVFICKIITGTMNYRDANIRGNHRVTGDALLE